VKDEISVALSRSRNNAISGKYVVIHNKPDRTDNVYTYRKLRLIGKSDNIFSQIKFLYQFWEKSDTNEFQLRIT
jgi:hypothetical protein